MEKIILSITDLTCASCVHRIEQVMRQQEGVVWATVNFDAGEATILFDPAVFRKNRFFRAVYQLGFHLDYKDEDITPLYRSESHPKQAVVFGTGSNRSKVMFL